MSYTCQHLPDAFPRKPTPTIMNPDGPPPTKKRRGKKGTLHKATDLYDVQQVRTTLESTSRGPGYVIKSIKTPMRPTDGQSSLNQSTPPPEDSQHTQPLPESDPVAFDDEDVVRVAGGRWKVRCRVVCYIYSLIFVQTQADYMREFIDHAPHLLDGLLAREYINCETLCSVCENRNIGKWRCRDCCSPEILCRGCMRRSHRQNALHRIEYWNGEFFRPAQLWEVGSYILVPHCTGEMMCRSLTLNVSYLEDFQRAKDDEVRTTGSATCESGNGWNVNSTMGDRERNPDRQSSSNQDEHDDAGLQEDMNAAGGTLHARDDLLDRSDGWSRFLFS